MICLLYIICWKFATYKRSEAHMDKQNTFTSERVQLALATVPHTHSDCWSLAYHASSNRVRDLAQHPHYLHTHNGGPVHRNCSINSVTLMWGVLACMPFTNVQCHQRRSRSALKVNYKVKSITSTRLRTRDFCCSLPTLLWCLESWSKTVSYCSNSKAVLTMLATPRSSICFVGNAWTV